MKRPAVTLTYTMLIAVLLFSAAADVRMANAGVPFGLIYLAPLFFLTLIVLYGVILGSSVVTLEKPSAPCPAAQPPDVSECDVLLVLDLAVDGGHSRAWLNTLASCFGPARATTPENLHKDAPGKNIIVIPSRESSSVIRDRASADAIIALANSGAAVIIDFPSAETAALLGIKLAEKTSAGRISWTYPGIMPAERAAWLTGCPVQIETTHAEFIGGGLGSWLRAGAHTAVAGKATGSGGIIVTFFDYASHSTMLKQGAVESGLAAAVTGPATFKLAAPELAGAKYPYADLLDEFMSSLAAYFAPSASWWPHPDGTASSFIVTCTDDGVGRRMGSALETFKKAAVTPTVFTLADRHNAAAALEGLKTAGIEPSLLWNRFSSYMLGGKPLKNKLAGISAQAGKIESESGARPVISRSYNLRWDGSAADNFALMHENGVSADSSFGPPPGGRGYYFATGFPFNPETESGGAAAVIEIPFHISDARNSFNAAERNAELVEAAADHNSALCADFNLRLHIGSSKARMAAADLLNTASLKGLKLMGLTDALEFHRARLSSSIRTVRDGGSIRITATAARDGMCLRVPANLRHAGKLHSVLLDGNSVELSSLVRGCLPPLCAGAHEIKLEYSPAQGGA